MLSKITIALVSTISILPTQAIAYTYINPRVFVKQSPEILRNLGASDSLLKINRVASEKMTEILESQMVQGMAKGTLSKEEWDRKYMRADALYIYNLGRALAIRAANENEQDSVHVRDFAEMFLGYGKHFERLKKYGLSAQDRLVSPECDQHIDFLSKRTSINEFYLAILTDMIPYVIFSNYLLHSIDPNDNNPWEEYAKKYGDLKNKYAKEKLGKTIQKANEILMHRKVDANTAQKIFLNGFGFEAWFIRNAFSNGFTINTH
jgi:thiaminase